MTPPPGAALFLLAGTLKDELDGALPQSLRDTLGKSSDLTTPRPIFRWDGAALTTTDTTGAAGYISGKLRGSRKLLGYAAIDPEKIAGLTSFRFTVSGKSFVIDPVGEDDLPTSALEPYRPFLVWLRRSTRTKDQTIQRAPARETVPNLFVDPLLFGEEADLTTEMLDEVLSETNGDQVQCALPYGLLLPPVFCPATPGDPVTGHGHFFDREHTGIRRRFRAAFSSRYAGLRLEAVCEATDDPLLNAILVRDGWLSLAPAKDAAQPVIQIHHNNERVDRYTRDLLNLGVSSVGPHAPTWATAVRTEFRTRLTTQIGAANLDWKTTTKGLQKWRLRRMPRPTGTAKQPIVVVGNDEDDAHTQLHSADEFCSFKWLDGDRTDLPGKRERLRQCLSDLAEGVNNGQGGYKLTVDLEWFHANVGQYCLKPILDQLGDKLEESGQLFQLFISRLPPTPDPADLKRADLRPFVEAILRAGTRDRAWRILTPRDDRPPTAFHLREQQRIRLLLDYFAPRAWRVCPFPHVDELLLCETSVLL